MPTIVDLGQHAKAKYPGAYDDLSDEELGAKIKAKYPAYNDFTDTPTAAQMSSMIEQQYGNKAVATNAVNALPTIGAVVGSAVGGPGGGIAGAGAGSFAKQALSPNPSLVQGAEDTATQGVLPEAIGGLANMGRTIMQSGPVKAITNLLPDSLTNMLPGVRAAKLINQAKNMMVPESMGIETLGENTRAITNPAKTAGTSLENIKQIPYTHTSLQSMPSIGKSADQLFSDVSEVRNAKLVDPTSVQQLAKSRILNDSFNFDSNTFNPGKALNTIGKSEAYQEALKGSNFQDFLQEAQNLKVGEQKPSLFSFKERGKLYIVGGLASAMLGPAAFAGTEGLILTGDVLNRIATNPQIGQLFITAMKTPPTSPVVPLLGKAIANSLRGASLIMKTSDGKNEKVVVGPGGQLQTPQQ